MDIYGKHSIKSCGYNKLYGACQNTDILCDNHVSLSKHLS